MSVARHVFGYAQDTAEQARQAKQAMLSRHYSEAVALYRQMEAESPSEPGIRFNLALALQLLGNYREAIQILEAIRSAAGSNPRFWFLLGEGYLALDEPQNAVQPLRRAEAMDPSNLNTRLELATALLDNGQCVDSEARFRSLSAEHPELPKAWAGLSLSQTGLAQVKEAKQSMQRLSEMPESVDQHEMLARIYVRMGQREKEIQELRAAEKLSPGNGRVQSAMARALIATREFPEAIARLQTLVATNPEDPASQFDLGDALLSVGQTEAAIQHLAKAVQISPGLLPAQAKLGEALLQIGSVDAALSHLQLAAPIDTDGSIHFQLATAYRRLQKSVLYAEAIARYQELQTQARVQSVEHSIR